MHDQGDGAARLILNLYLSLFLLWLILPVVALLWPAFDAIAGASFDATAGGWAPPVAAVFADAGSMRGLLGSLAVGLAVVALSLPLGLAGALAIHRLGDRAAGLLFAVLVAPILVPGVVQGLAASLAASEVGIDGGLVLAALARSSQTAACAMLLFLARLDPLDPRLEQAAIDLGASRGLVMRRILWPHLAPTAVVAGLVAFVQGFGDHDTIALALGGERTLVGDLVARLPEGAGAGADPRAAATGVLVVAVTLAVVLLWLRLRHRETPLDAARR